MSMCRRVIKRENVKSKQNTNLLKLIKMLLLRATLLYLQCGPLFSKEKLKTEYKNDKTIDLTHYSKKLGIFF